MASDASTQRPPSATHSGNAAPDADARVSWLVIVPIAYSFFALNFINYTMTPMFPQLLKQASVSDASMQLAISTMVGVYSASGAVIAFLVALCVPADSSRKRLQVCSLLITAISVPMSFLPRHFVIMVAARILQGGAVGTLWLASLATITEVTPERMVGTVVGIINFSLTAGCMLGPVAGGLIAQRHSANRDATIVCLGLASVGLMLHCCYRSQRLDAPVPIPSEPVDGRERSRRDTSLPIPAQERTPLLNHVHAPQRKKEPFRALTVLAHLIRSRNVLAGAVGMVAACSTLAALDSALAIFATTRFNWGPGRTSSLWLIMTLPQLSSPLLGRFADAFGFLFVLRAGLVTTVVGCVTLMLTTLDDYAYPVVLFCVGLLLVGTGATTVIPTSMAQVSLAAERASQAANSALSPGEGAFQSGALVNICLALPGVIGPAWTSTIQGSSHWIIFCASLAAVNAFGLLTLLIRP